MIQYLLSTTIFVSVAAQTLNPALKLAPKNPALEGKVGVVRIYKSPNTEVHLKSTPLPDEAAAKRALEVGFGLIRGLYEPKKNPYAGEVTALVKCDKKFAPAEFKLKCPAQTTQAIAGGVGDRHAFGMCTEKDIREIGVFFACYDPLKKELVEVRLFVPYESGRSWKTQLQGAKKLAAELFD